MLCSAAMVLRNILFQRVTCLKFRRNLRTVSLAAADIPEVAVLQSTSTDVFANLAFEDWIYKNVDLSNRRILFLWRNTPTVVIGRHQNPWCECNLRLLEKHEVKLARRMSGGGAVYHDLGNVNITFFSPRKWYNRRENLAVILDALRGRWNVDVGVSCRDDIILNGKYKISGSSSKLARVQSYHHCTLLCDVNTSLLKNLLNPTHSDVSGKATASVKSDVMNLSAMHKSINFGTVTETMARVFHEQYRSRFPEMMNFDKDTLLTQITYVDPSSEGSYPGVTDAIHELQSWQWTFGQTPKFCATFSTDLSFGDLSVSFHTFHGVIESVELHCNDVTEHDFLGRIPLVLRGIPFRRQDVSTALRQYLNRQALFGTERKLFVELCAWMERVLHSGALCN